MKYSILILAALLLILGSCSRFEHDFAPKETVDFAAVLFNPLQAAFDEVSSTNMEPVMSRFADDYIHYGIDKAARETYFQSLYSVSSELDYVISLINAEELSENTGIATWNLKIYSAASKALLADSTFVNERLTKQNGTWLLRGNGLSGSTGTSKARIIIEYFTFVGCPNCPIVEARIRELQTQYPTQLSYVEYHVSGELSFGLSHNDLLAYYSAFPSPVSIIQGTNKLTGSSTEVLQNYTNLVGTLSSVDAQLSLEDFSYSVSGRNISAQVRVRPENPGFDTGQLRLKYVLLKKTWNFANPATAAHHNVAMAKGNIDISSTDLANPISFSLQSPIDIPADAYLLVYAQKHSVPFANNSPIYNGIEVPIATRK